MGIKINSEKIETQRNYNLDLIKAICILLVLFWHLKPFDISIPNLTEYSINLFFKEALIAFYFQLTLIAVPAFLITSQYLYFQKLKQYGYSYFLKRIWVLVYITGFWISMQFIFYYIIEPLIHTNTTPAPLPSSSTAWIRLIMVGGPFQQNSAFYYLTSLIALTILSTVFVMICKTRWLEMVIGGLIIIGSLVYFEIQAFHEVSITYARIENFILYSPIAYFIYMYGNKSRLATSITLWFIYILFCIQDFQLRHAGLQFNLYGRASVAFGAVALVYSLINMKNLKESKLVNFLSSHSLGIFALHLYVYYFLDIYLLPLFIDAVRRKYPIWEFRVDLQVLAMGILTILFTTICAYILGKTPLRRFVT